MPNNQLHHYFNKDYILFIMARFSGILTKPVILFILLHLQLIDTSAQLSQFFLILSSVLVIYSVPIHFNFYKRIFEEKKPFYSLRQTFLQYTRFMYLHIILISPFILGICFFLTEDFILSLFIVAALFTDKCFDEFQRFLQFSKSFRLWSLLFLMKTLIPFITLLFSYFFIDQQWLIYVFIASSVLVTTIIYFAYIPSIIRCMIRTSIFVPNINAIKHYLHSIKSLFGYRYIQSIFSANIQNIDKWVAAILYPPLFLSELLVVSQISNGIHIGTNNLVLAHRRNELLQSNNTLSSLLMHWKTPALIFCLVVCAFIIILFSGQSYEFSELSLSMTLLIPIAYGFMAISEPLKEFLFWNVKIQYTLAIDFIYFLSIIIPGTWLYIIGEYTYLPVFLLLGLVLRTSALLIFIQFFSQKFSI